MTCKKVFRTIDYLVIFLSTVMIVIADGWMESML